MKKLFLLFFFLPWIATAQQQTISVGTSANDGTGDPLRTAMQKINANFTEVYDNILPSGVTSGTNSYSVSPDPAIPSLANGRRILVNFSNANTSGTVTLNASSLGAQPVKDNTGADLAIGAIPADGSFVLRYNGTQWRVIGSAGGGGGTGTLASVGLTLGTSGTDAAVSGSPLTSDGSITLNIPSSSGSNRGLLTAADWTTFNGKSPAAGSGSLTTTGTLTSGSTGTGYTLSFTNSTLSGRIAETNIPAKYIFDRVSTVTTGGTITLDMNSQISRHHTGSATFATGKVVAMSNVTNSESFRFTFTITSTSAIITVPTDWGFNDMRFNGTDWAATATGRYTFIGSWDGTNWNISVDGPFSN